MRTIYAYKLAFGVLMASFAMVAAPWVNVEARLWWSESPMWSNFWAFLAHMSLLGLCAVVAILDRRGPATARSVWVWHHKYHQAFNYLAFAMAVTGVGIMLNIGLGVIRLHGNDVWVIPLISALCLVVLPLTLILHRSNVKRTK